ncbi:MAG: sulfite exporter TauE/SafE family protein [Pyrinomonadaceae bacterium]
MTITVTLLIAALILIVAVLYSTVGHAGASGYLAAMALFGVTPLVMKPTALTLNIIVATVGTIRFSRAGFFSWRTFWPFAIVSIPAAFVGGWLTLPASIYKAIVGVVLLYSAVRIFFSAKRAADDQDTRKVPLFAALVWGTAIGLLSGLTGVGGGIFLSPLLLLMHWAKTKETAAVSVTFILVNSIAGLLGHGLFAHLTKVATLPRAALIWGPLALVGGLIGTELGTRRLPIARIRRWLSVVLVIAGAKLLSEAILPLLQR